MKRLLALFCCLYVLTGLCGCAGSQAEPETDYLHYENEKLSLDITPPESWPETAAPLTLLYGSLGTAALESVLTEPVESQRFDTVQHEEGESEAEAAEHYWKSTLSGADGAWWMFFVGEGTWGNLNTIPSYWYYAEADTALEAPAGMPVETADFDEETQAAGTVASEFLAQLGISNAVLEYARSLDETDSGCAFYYHYWHDSLLEETGRQAPGEQKASGIEVYVIDSTVTHVQITNVVTEITEQDEQPLISPEEAAEILATEYSDDTNNIYVFSALELRYYEVCDYETGTGEARPAWVFSTAEDAQVGKELAVDAITGEILK